MPKEETNYVQIQSDAEKLMVLIISKCQEYSGVSGNHKKMRGCPLPKSTLEKLRSSSCKLYGIKKSNKGAFPEDIFDPRALTGELEVITKEILVPAKELLTTIYEFLSGDSHDENKKLFISTGVVDMLIKNASFRCITTWGEDICKMITSEGKFQPED